MHQRPLLLAAVLLAATSARAADPDPEGCKDSPIVQRFPGASMTSCDAKEFDSIDIPAGVDAEKNVTTKTFEGKYITYRYTIDPKHSALEIGRNYQNALKKAGAQILVDAGATNYPRQVTGYFAKTNTYVNFNLGDGEYSETIVTPKQMEQVVEATAGSLLDELNKSGHVAVYGINFETGKATLSDGSEKVLGEVATLLKDNADLKLRVEGHTDNEGNPKSNLELSKKRAAAVKEWLVKNGVEGARLKTEGFGDKKPVGDNNTDEGKAKNRRVELVKL